MEINGNEKVAAKYYCNCCDYYSSKKSNYDKHILSAKHKKLLLEINGNETMMDCNIFTCEMCSRAYKTISGLWKHDKKCSQSSPNHKTKIILDIIKKDDMVKAFLIEQNKQLSEQNKTLIEQNTKLFEIAQNTKGNTIINGDINSNNKFSINVFLNEHCKDALNIDEFVNSLVLGINELECTAKLGYAEGISKIFIDGLNQLNVCKRPLHCSDSKREILYIKEDDQWVKENTNKEKITNAIKKIANKNIKQISEWQKANPEYMNPSSKQNDKYMKMICEVMSGSSKEEQQKNYSKIIKNVSKEVIIDKYDM